MPEGRKFDAPIGAWVCAIVFLLLLARDVGAEGTRARKGQPPAVDPEGVPPSSSWSSAAAFDLAMAGAAAAQRGNWSACVDKDGAALALEEQPRTRLHVASCEGQLGHYLAALADALKARKESADASDAPAVERARARISEFLPLIAHVTFVLPEGIGDLQLAFDGKPVPLESASKKFAVDPGVHTVHAEATVNGLPVSFDRTYDCADGELVTAAIMLVPRKADFLSSGELDCILGARNQPDVFTCLPESGTHFVQRASMEMGAYSDDTHVEVLSPKVSASVNSPTQGWNLGGSYLVDVVSAASPDIVSEASPAFHEVRQAGTLTGGYKPSVIGAQVTGHVSSEPDYLSGGGGVVLTADLDDKLVTPRLGYDYTHDTIGRGGTPFSVFHHTLEVNEFDGGLTFVLSRRSLLIVNAGVAIERGDQSKPYRYVPIFAPGVAPFVPRGASVALVNSVRLPVRPLEQLPLARNRYSLSARLNHRFQASTLRIEERLYLDSWEQMATTTDIQYLIDVGSHVLVSPQIRFNAQNGADFYQRAYAAAIPATANGSLLLPAYRTTNRELSPLMTVFAGLGARFALSPPMASTQYGLSFRTDAMFTRYLDALFLTSRTAIYGTLGFDAEFQ